MKRRLHAQKQGAQLQRSTAANCNKKKKTQRVESWSLRWDKQKKLNKNPTNWDVLLEKLHRIVLATASNASSTRGGEMCRWTQRRLRRKRKRRREKNREREREREHRKRNKRQQNRVGTQWSRAQHTRTGCNCVVLDWPWRIPAGTAWWMGLAVTTSRIPPPPPPPPGHVLYSLSVATISPPSSPFPLQKNPPKPHTLFSCCHPTRLICIQCT